ncbi:MAG TPA: hypothetical protein VJ672_10070 [Gemmatimonadaceae bacterium]|nr:hypothetical protein [Gemmatimonadaceae bacterium]
MYYGITRASSLTSLASRQRERQVPPNKSREPLEALVQFRLSKRDAARLRRVAEGDHLSPGTWVRQVVLRALDAREARLRAVAERPPRGE